MDSKLHYMHRYYRKGIHFTLALTFALGALVVSTQVLMACATLLLAVFVGARYLRQFDRIRRAEEGSHGEFFFAVGVFTSALLFLPAHPAAFTVAMLVLGIADASAAVVGIRWGTHEYRIFGERRTYEGSFVVLLVSFPVLLLGGIGAGWALLGGWILATVEAIAPRGSDNLFLPLIAGTLTIALKIMG